MITRVVAVALGALAVGTALLVVAEAIPDGPVVRRVEASREAGGHGQVLAPDAFGGLHDGFTECVALGVGLGQPPEPMGLVARAIWAPRIGACEEQADQLPALAAGEEVEAGPYYRYWNGAGTLVRPTVALVGVGGLRVLVAVLLGAAGIGLLAVLVPRLGGAVTAALLGPALLASNVVVTPAGCFTHAISLAVVAAGTAVVAVATERHGPRGAAAAAAAGAAAFVYVDLLTTPAVPWALAAFVAGGVVAARGRRTGSVAAATLAAGVAWPAAWAATWAARWLLAAAVHGRQVLSSIAEVSRFRVSGELPGIEDAVGAATRTNVDWWWGHTRTARPVAAVLVVVTVAALVAVVRRRATGSRLGTVVVLGAPALLVPAWYEVLSNHSQVHAFFTYRGVPVALGIGAAAFVLAARRPSRARLLG